MPIQSAGTAHKPTKDAIRLQPRSKRQLFMKVPVRKPTTPPPKCAAALMPGHKLIMRFRKKTYLSCPNHPETRLGGRYLRFDNNQAASEATMPQIAPDAPAKFASGVNRTAVQLPP